MVYGETRVNWLALWNVDWRRRGHISCIHDRRRRCGGIVPSGLGAGKGTGSSFVDQ